MQNEKSTFLGKAFALETASFGIEREYQRMLKALENDITGGRPDRARDRLEMLILLDNCRQMVGYASEVLNGNKGKPLYLCSAWFLRDCGKELTRTNNESMFFISGLEIGSARTLDRRIPLQYAEQSAFFVSANDQSTRQALKKLDENGQWLLAWFHSHPGSGPGATLPSAIDKNHQGDLEQGGYHTIGAVFARDGHVRFFSSRLEFDVVVLGKGVEQINGKLFKLSGF